MKVKYIEKRKPIQIIIEMGVKERSVPLAKRRLKIKIAKYIIRPA
ncbi:MAG: hypothetical protein Q8N65_01515 [bacterium]|nr:hypothetical protein [bacterium]